MYYNNNNLYKKVRNSYFNKLKNKILGYNFVRKTTKIFHYKTNYAKVYLISIFLPLEAGSFKRRGFVYYFKYGEYI